MNIAKIMIPKVFTAVLHENSTLRQGYETMKHHGYTAIPVLDENERYVGSVTEGDFLRVVMDGRPKEVHDKLKIGDIIRRDFCKPLYIDAEEDAVINAVMSQNYVPVVDSLEALCGIVTRRKVIEYLSGRLD